MFYRKLKLQIILTGGKTVNKTYDEFIGEILTKRGRFNCGDEYHERHHIVPKCLGGSDDDANLIDLFAREHFIAHRLLALENPDNDKLVYAWWAMSHLSDHNQKRVEVSAEEYEEAKNKYKESIRQRMSGINNPMFGISPKERMDAETYIQWRENIKKTTNSNEFKQQARELNIGKKYSDDINKKKGKSGSAHHLYGKHQTDEVKQKIREANTGRVQTEETRNKISNALKGEKNPFYGKHHSEETKRKISEANKGKSKRIKGADKPNARKVAQYDKDGQLVKIWDYMREPYYVLGISYNGIYACCNDKQKNSRWFYMEICHRGGS